MSFNGSVNLAELENNLNAGDILEECETLFFYPDEKGKNVLIFAKLN